MTSMTMQPRGNNPIQQRKDDVRKYSRTAVACVGGGLAGGVILSIVASNWAFWMTIGVIVAVVGGYLNYRKVQRIVNHKDPQ